MGRHRAAEPVTPGARPRGSCWTNSPAPCGPGAVVRDLLLPRHRCHPGRMPRPCRGQPAVPGRAQAGSAEGGPGRRPESRAGGVGRAHLAGLSRRPNHVAATRFGVKKHHCLPGEVPRGRLVSGSALRAMCQPLLQGLDHGADRRARRERKCPHEKVNSPPRVCRPPLPPRSLTRIARRSQVVPLPPEHRGAEVGVRFSPVRWKAGARDGGVERPDVEVLDATAAVGIASTAMQIVHGCSLRQYNDQPA